MWFQQTLIVLALTFLTCPVEAFDKCDSSFKDAREFAERASTEAIKRAPVMYRDMTSVIQLEVDVPASKLIPFATEDDGKRTVVLPMAFARIVCQMSLATYMRFEDVQPESFSRASQAAAACIDSGRAMNACLVAFGNDLAERYRGAFAKLTTQSQDVAMAIFYSALWQIEQHEYAHHYLDHFSRIAADQISRIDAEFEADLYAIMNGVEAGDSVTSMYYFFDGLAGVEDSTQTLSTPDYESGSCRAGNVSNITAFVGIVPLLLVDAAGGGGAMIRFNSAATLREQLADHFGKTVPTLNPESCGLIAKVALRKTYDELKQVSTRIVADTDLLFSEQNAIDLARASRLVRDLMAMTQKFEYVDGVASKSIAFMLINWGLKGRARTPLMVEVDRLLEDEKVVANLQSEDYGRLLSAQGLAVLQERVDLPAQSRLDQSFEVLKKALHYNPAISEAWMNLAFISFLRGDCPAAARYGQNAQATLNDDEKENAEATAFFVKTTKALSADSSACKAAAELFHPYKGL